MLMNYLGDQKKDTAANAFKSAHDEQQTRTTRKIIAQLRVPIKRRHVAGEPVKS